MIAQNTQQDSSTHITTLDNSKNDHAVHVDSNSNNVDNSSDYNENEYCNILLIGIGFNRKLLSQLVSKSGEQINISTCTDENGIRISEAVARDMFRAAMIEEDYYHKVFTVHKCNDHMRNEANENDTNLTCDCNTRHFIKNVKKKCFFHEIYIENFRMPTNYLVKSFSKRFIENLVQLSEDGHLKDFDDNRPRRILFPFCAHFFHILHAEDSVKSQFDFSYLTSDQVNRDTHKLSYSTNIHKTEIHQTDFLKNRIDILLADYSPGLMLTKGMVEIIL